MNNELQINVGDFILLNEKQKNAVIFIDQNIIVTINTETKDKYDLFIIWLNELQHNTLKLEVLKESENIVVDESDISNAYLKTYLEKKRIVLLLEEIYYKNSYLTLNKQRDVDYFAEIAKSSFLCSQTIRRSYLHYLQSGKKFASLIDKRMRKHSVNSDKSVRRGRKSVNYEGKVIDDKDLDNFKEAVKYYKSKSGEVTLRDAYKNMIFEHYSETEFDGSGVKVVAYSLDKRPTFRQFDYHTKKFFSSEDILLTKKGSMSYRNENRILSGSSEMNVTMPYDVVEMDIVEFDVALIDSFNGKTCVGRPIVYLMKDVLTKMIVSTSIAFDNNSYIGLSNCFSMLNESKKEICEKYNIIGVTDEVWPTGYKPKTIRVDNGSDFISKATERMCKELGINLDIVSPGMGSYKGVVERSFHDAHQKLTNILSKNGYITKKVDSKHHETATLNIEEFRAIFYRYVIFYNTTINKGISLSRNMRILKIPQTPKDVMNYYLGFSKPQLLPTGDQFLKALLVEDTATLSGNGITFCNLNYIGFNDQDLVDKMRKLQRKREKFKILYDPRTVNVIYYIKNNELIRVYLNENFKLQKSYINMTFEEYKRLLKEYNENKFFKENEDLNKELTYYTENKNIVEIAKKNRKEHKVNNISKNRQKEKEKAQKDFVLDKKLQVETKENNTNNDVTKDSYENFVEEFINSLKG